MKYLTSPVLRLVMLILLIGMTSYLQAQTRTITGTVLDADSGEPLVGAVVQIKDKATGTYVEESGTFSLSGLSDADSINVSYFGYVKQTLSVAGQSTFTISLSEEIMGMDDVVIVGYGTQKKSDLTGAVSSVKMDEVDELPVATLGQALQGRIAGVTVTQSTGSPGAGLDITIRGAGTINNSSPLYVVDGIIVDNIDYLSVNDIASTEVLKDASAAAVYGARAANGVILVTTKQGKSGEMTVSVSSQISQSDYWKRLDIMGREDYLLLQNLANLNPQNALVQMKRLESGTLISGDNDWLDLISRKGMVQSHSLSVSGGSETARFRLSGTQFDNLGIIKGTDYQRQTILGDITTKPSKRLKLRGNFVYSTDERNRLTEGDNSIVLRALRDAPTTTVVNDEGNLNGTPVRQATTGTDKREEDVFQIKGFLDYVITDNISYSAVASLDNEFFEEDVFTYSSSTDPTRYNFDTPDRYNGGLATVRRENGERFKWTVQNRINYDFQFGDHSLSGVGVFELEKQWLERADAQGKSAIGNDSLREDITAISTQYVVSGTYTEWSNVGAVGRISYGYAGKYLAQVNFRADGSSRFIGEKWGYFPSVSLGWVLSEENFLANNKALTFLKLRGSWGQSGNNRVSDYVFATRVNNGFRAVFGGDDVVDGATPTTVANSLISWEKTTSTNVGLDMILFNRVEVNVDVFEKYTSDMLINVPVVPSAGLDSNPLRNAGDVRNRGLEFMANYRVRTKIGSRNFKMDIGGNFTFIQNEVVKLGDRNEPVFGNVVAKRGANGDFGVITRAEVGKPIGAFYGWVTDGIFMTREEVENSAQSALAQPGDFRFKDLNGDGEIDEADRTYLGSPMPDFTYGMIANISYGNFDLSMAWQGVYGQNVFNASLFYLNGFNGSNARSGVLAETWNSGYFTNAQPINIGDVEVTQADIDRYAALYPANLDASIPRLTLGTNDINENWRASNYFIEDASYLRLKNAQLSYNLKLDLLTRIGVKNLKIYLMGQNLLTFTQYSGLDPEIGKRSDASSNNLNFGLDIANYPQSRTITLGANLTL